MTSSNNDFFQRMCRDAAEELASGRQGWHAMETNTLLMACFHLLTNHLTHAITKPLWFFAGSVASGVIFYIVQAVLGFE